MCAGGQGCVLLSCSLPGAPGAALLCRRLRLTRLAVPRRDGWAARVGAMARESLALLLLLAALGSRGQSPSPPPPPQRGTGERDRSGRGDLAASSGVLVVTGGTRGQGPSVTSDLHRGDSAGAPRWCLGVARAARIPPAAAAAGPSHTSLTSRSGADPLASLLQPGCARLLASL